MHINIFDISETALLRTIILYYIILKKYNILYLVISVSNIR
jgi:hypothetical protein